MNNYLNLNVPTIRHSDLRVISKSLSLRKTNYYYENLNSNLEKNLKEFKQKKYININQDAQLFKHRKKNLYKKRSEILKEEIFKNFNTNSKILDFGCNKGELLYRLKQSGFKKIFDYNINQASKKKLKRKKINFLNLNKIAEKKFDIIIFSHSLSYVKNIKKLLIILKKALSRNGNIVINCADVAKRPFILCLGDQKYFFEKQMLKNLFKDFGSIKFIKSNYLTNDILSIISFNQKKRLKVKSINNKNFKILKSKVKRINQIKKKEKKIYIYHYNFQSMLIYNIINSKTTRIISIKKTQSHENFIISIKAYLKSKASIIISKLEENKKIIYLIKKKNLKYYLI